MSKKHTTRSAPNWKDDRELILKALHSQHDTKIARAVANRMMLFTEKLTQMIINNGHLQAVMLEKPETAFDDIVIRLTLQTFSDELGKPIEIHWV